MEIRDIGQSDIEDARHLLVEAGWTDRVSNAE
jgi:hypothetical protein